MFQIDFLEDDEQEEYDFKCSRVFHSRKDTVNFVVDFLRDSVDIKIGSLNIGGMSCKCSKDMVIYLLNNDFLLEEQLEQYDILFLQEIVPDAVKILVSQFKEYVFQ